MKTGPINLNSVFFTEVKISANPAAKGDDLYNINLEIKPFLSASSEDKREWGIVLAVEFTSKEGVVAPYVGEVEAFGNFSVVEGWPESEIEKLVYINGCGILYASMREMVAIITSRGFFDTLSLPSCSFAEMYKDKKENEKKEAESAQQPPLDLPGESRSGAISEESGKAQKG